MLGYNHEFWNSVFEYAENKEKCHSWLNKLSKRERIDLSMVIEQTFKSRGIYGVLIAYFESNQNQKQLSSKYGVSQATVSRQISGALAKLRSLLIKQWRCPYVEL